MAPLRDRALNSGDIAAAQALAEMGDDSAIRFLHWRTLADMDPNDETTWQVSKALALMLPGERLIDRLQHEHAGLRYQAVWTASQEGHVDVLAEGLEDTNVKLRRAAIHGLATQYGPLDDDPGECALRLDAMARALADSEADIRLAAAIGLAEEGEDDGAELLRAGLRAAGYATRIASRSALQALRLYRP